MIMCFHFMYMSILPNSKTYMYTPWVICFSCKSLYMDSIVFRNMYVYFLCWQNIHMPWRIIFFNEKFRFSWFMFKGISIELECKFSWLWSSHFTCTLTFLVYSCFIFMSHIHASLTLSVDYLVNFLLHEKWFCVIPYLKDFVLVFKFFHN